MRSHNSHTVGGMLDHSIRDLLIPSMSPEFYGWIGKGGRLAWYQSRGPEFNHVRPHINFAARNNFHLPCCSLST
jgi:hypothetical protein